MSRMVSSTSSSETAPVGWRVWLGTCGVVFGGAFAFVWLFLLLIDPYDSGRFPALGLTGIVDESPRTANVSRGRNVLFNAGLFGNSTGQLLDPARLSEATNLRFVQLTVPGTGPREQLTMLRWFISHHERIGAIVIVADGAWCTPDPLLPLTNPFPFWLYSGNIDYLRHLLSWHSFELALRRIALALGWRKPSDPAGYWNYEAGKVWSFDPGPGPAPPADDMPAPASLAPDQMAFPAIARLDEVVSELPPAVPVVLVIPPVFAGSIAPPDSPSEMRLAQCKTALAQTVFGRQRSDLIDFRTNNAMTRDPTNFMDVIHYRAKVARRMEQSIAAAIGSADASRDLEP
jgi:hypothetical protein